MQKEELWIRLSYLSDWTPEKYINSVKYLEKNLAKLSPQNKEALFFYGFNAKDIVVFWSKTETEIEEELYWLKQNNRWVLPLHHPRYPQTLFHSTCPPKLLWCEGNLSLLNQETLSIIGTRKPSFYGKHWAKIFTQALSQDSLIIISGLSLGIDSIIHQTLIDMNKPTIAIIGSGLENIYPASHQPLAYDILKKGGLLVSAVSPKTPQTIERFACKNYLIATLSRALFVIEASLKSGSLMTARFAIEESREVFTLAHPIGQSEGTHWLIKQGSHLVTHQQDIKNQMNTALNWLRVT